jgi:hypothetical protein
VNISLLTSFAYGNCPSRSRIDGQISDSVNSVQKVSNNGEDKNGNQNPCTADGSSRDEHQNAADDLAPSQYQAYDVWQVSTGEAVSADTHQQRE